MIEEEREIEKFWETSVFSSPLPAPVLIAENDIKIKERLKNILIELNYQKTDLIFSENLHQSLLIAKNKKVSFALVDLNLSNGDGTKLIKTLRQKNTTIPILVISALNTKEAVLTAIQAGATGYLLKERDDFEVSMSIKQILKGGLPIDPFLIQIILSTEIKPLQRRSSLTETLSTRELEILELVTQGLNNQDIANELGLSRYTIEAHLRNIYGKLSVDSRSKAINIAYSLGFF
ncbi:response regulator transcription factor [Acinetobacter sp. Ac_5812]|uniref:response regulator transcription factor n=1 Tax=Acinetobacter sp. Ac_5812 TaxID=1848937 RepID=UPI00148FE5EE|nr:response regulator transcription factor [Acinetobacter sp. Ac_5812]NNP69226.1 DNA-binding response regulator [Acinetobacter sp. Ac_5812]